MAKSNSDIIQQLNDATILTIALYDGLYKKTFLSLESFVKNYLTTRSARTPEENKTDKALMGLLDLTYRGSVLPSAPLHARITPGDDLFPDTHKMLMESLLPHEDLKAEYKHANNSSLSKERLLEIYDIVIPTVMESFKTYMYMVEPSPENDRYKEFQVLFLGLFSAVGAFVRWEDLLSYDIVTPNEEGEDHLMIGYILFDLVSVLTYGSLETTFHAPYPRYPSTNTPIFERFEAHKRELGSLNTREKDFLYSRINNGIRIALDEFNEFHAEEEWY